MAVASVIRGYGWWGLVGSQAGYRAVSGGGWGVKHAPIARPIEPELLRAALDNKIHIAFSNPCVELWAVLHLETRAPGRLTDLTFKKDSAR